MDRIGTSSDLFSAHEKKQSFTGTKVVTVFACIWVMSFLVGAAISKVFDFHEDGSLLSMFAVYSDYTVSGKDILAGLKLFLQLCSFDLKCLGLIFVLGFCFFPLIGSAIILIYRGASTGIFLGVSAVIGSFSTRGAISVLLLVLPMFLSSASITFSCFSAYTFSKEFRSTKKATPIMFKTKAFSRYFFMFLISVGICAVASGLRMIQYVIG